jgi:hypothetical protein
MTGSFKPKRLPSLSVNVPMERRWDVMGDEEAKRLHARAHAEHRRWSLFAPRNKHRALRCFLLTPVGFATLGWAFVGGNPRTALAFLIAGVALGAMTFLLRPVDYLSGALYAGAGIFAAVLCGKTPLFLLASIALLCGCIGIAQGRVEAMRRLDMED